MDQTRTLPTPESRRGAGRTRRMRGIVSVAIATAALLLVAIAPTSAAAVDRSWRAKVGASGANGAVTVVAYTSDTGAATLRLKSLPASTMTAVSLRAGTCAKPGSVAATLAATRSSSAGRLNATQTLSKTAVKRLRAARSLVAMVTSGSFSRCATLAQLAVPTASPSPSAGSAAVEIKAAGFAFTPASITVAVGVPLTVDLRNEDAGVRHGFTVGTSTSSTPLFSATIISGVSRETFTVPALPAGTYVFYCPVHTSMTGTFTVGAAASAASPSPAASASAAPAATSEPTAPPATPDPMPYPTYPTY